MTPIPNTPFDQEWIDTWEQNKPAIMDMISRAPEYFAKNYPTRIENCKTPSELYETLNALWFELPDNRYNIMRMPHGWKEFLEVLEVS